MNRPSYDEFEEVESPFAKKEEAPRDRLRTRKNVFNRPFATEPTAAPLILETTSTRRSIGHPDMTDMIQTRSSELSETGIDYLDGEEEAEVEGEEEEVETRPAPRTNNSVKKKQKAKKNLLTKVGWSVVGILVLRLICMDRGVWDYFATESDIREKKEELRLIQQENSSLKTEIARIQMDNGYQKFLAKEHLGVIAADEFLILFAGETEETPSEDNRQL